MDEGVKIAIVGMGGIGSHLLHSLAPALHAGRLSESLGGFSLHIFDSDSVSESKPGSSADGKIQPAASRSSSNMKYDDPSSLEADHSGRGTRTGTSAATC